ncbi:MAG: alpha/beta hydrolase [Bacteroidetes bacterium]|nr:alpha/beta hydrolase [Bacteroidota bacterium]
MEEMNFIELAPPYFLIIGVVIIGIIKFRDLDEYLETLALNFAIILLILGGIFFWINSHNDKKTLNEMVNHCKDFQSPMTKRDSEEVFAKAMADTSFPLEIIKSNKRKHISVIKPNIIKQHDYFIVPVFYGTDRNPTGSQELDNYYGSKRNLTKDFQVGIVNVTLPITHEMGELESPWFVGMQNRFYDYTDISKYVTLLNIDTSSARAYRRLKALVFNSDENDAFVFIHGYNTSFKEAARRTAQIAYDVGFNGAPILYSWPSKNKTVDYLADRNEIEWTIPHLIRFLEKVVALSNAKKIHLIAHSMGTDILTKALKNFEFNNSDIQFNEIILAAPDIDVESFRNNIAPNLVRKAKRITIYASSNDRALVESKKVNGHNPRLGNTEGNNYFIMKGYELIDASNLEISDFFNHSLYAKSRAVLTDITELLHSDTPPLKRNLIPISFSKGTYYQFKK